MNKFLVTLTFSIILLSFSAAAHADQYFPPTPSQKHFTNIIGGLPGVVSTDWRSPVSLWVKVSSKAVGSPPNQEKANSLANILAERGRTALYQPFCVHIYMSNGKELSRDCVF